MPPTVRPGIPRSKPPADREIEKLRRTVEALAKTMQEPPAEEEPEE